MPAKLSVDAEKSVAFLLHTVKELFDDWQANSLKQVCMCDSRLLVAITSMWHDRRRMQDFHEIITPDRYKNAAFLTYWLAKIQPLQAKCESGETKFTEHKLLANAVFALKCAFAIMKVDASKLNSNIYRNVLYTLMYRHVSPEHLALTYQALFEPPPQ